MMIRSLISDTRNLHELNIAEEIGDFFPKSIQNLFGSFRSGGESEYQKLSETALSLEELDLGRQDPPLSFQEARQFFLQQLEGMKVNRGHYLAEG